MLTNAKLITARRTGLRKQDRRNFFADFGKWHIEKVFEKVLKYTELYTYLNSKAYLNTVHQILFCVIWNLHTLSI